MKFSHHVNPAETREYAIVEQQNTHRNRSRCASGKSQENELSVRRNDVTNEKRMGCADIGSTEKKTEGIWSRHSELEVVTLSMYYVLHTLLLSQILQHDGANDRAVRQDHRPNDR